MTEQPHQQSSSPSQELNHFSEEEKHLLNASGAPLSSEQETQTERSLERNEEDRRYVPVIIKRTDQVTRHPDDVLEAAISEGEEQLRRPFVSLLISAIAAGLILGFTVMAVAVASTLLLGFEQSPLVIRLGTALVYPLGFIICLMSGTQLFTEHTATAVYPILEQRSNFLALFRLWGVVIVGNMIGALGSAALLTMADEVIQAKIGYEYIAHHLVHFDHATIVISGILAGWLMALGGWLILATPPTISQIVCIYIVTFLIGLGGLHHSIAGSVEMFTGLFISDQFSWSEGIQFICFAILGNLIGGSVFVAILNYSHIRRTQEINDS